MTKSQILTAASLSASLPALPQPLIRRDNVLELIEEAASTDPQLIIVEGRDGAGKTTLLADMVSTRPNQAVSIFISSADRWSYNPDSVLIDTCNQLSCIAFGQELTPDQVPDRSLLARLVHSALAKQKKIRSPLYFVIDGLDEVPTGDVSYREELTSFVPIGLPGICVVTSRRGGDRLQWETGRAKMRMVSLPGFSLEESKLYLSDLLNDQEFINSVHSSFRGIPGRLAAIRRIVAQRESDVRSLLSRDLHTELDQLFELEWQNVDPSDNKLRIALGVLAYDRRRYSLPQLSEVLGEDFDTVARLLSGLSFIELSGQDGDVRFVSDDFQDFASEKLRSIKDESFDLIIKNLLGNHTEDANIALIPTYLEQAGRLEELLDYLSPEHIIRLIRISRSMTPVRAILDLGAQSARKLDRNGEFLQFSLQESTIAQLSNAQPWRAEVEARLAIGDFEIATSLAQSVLPRADRFHLMVVVAKSKRQAGLQIEPEVAAEIENLFAELETDELEGRVEDIAVDLMHYSPRLAINLVERVVPNEVGENSLDWAFVYLSLSALKGLGSDNRGGDLTSWGLWDQLRTRIKGAVARRFSSAAALLVGQYSASQVLKEVEHFSNVGERIYLLRQWARVHPRNADASDVILFALEQMISTVEYAPNASVLVDLATPLPFIDDIRVRRQLVNTLSGQGESIRTLGPIEDYVRLQLLLIDAEASFDKESARERAVDVALLVESLADLSVRGECAALFAAALALIDTERVLEQRDSLHSTADELLSTTVETLSRSTAQQEAPLRGIIRALSTGLPEQSISIAQSLNTEERRDEMLAEFVDASLEGDLDHLRFDLIAVALDEIIADQVKGKVIQNLLTDLYSKHDLDKLSDRDVAPIIDRIEDLLSASGKCLAYCSAYSLLNKVKSDLGEEYHHMVLDRIGHAWTEMDVSWLKVHVGLEAVVNIAKVDKEPALKFLQEAERIKRELPFYAEDEVITYGNCIRLAIRAFGGLLIGHVASESDLDRLAALIDELPSDGERVQLWADLAARCYLKSHREWCELIVNRHINAVLGRIEKADTAHWNQVINSAAPILYCVHPQPSIRLVRGLPQPQRENALRGILHFLSHRSLPSEPFDYVSGHDLEIPYGSMVDMISVMEESEYDTTIYEFLVHIVDSVSTRRGRQTYSANQRQELARRLTDLVDRKLPTPRRIPHDGFKIAALGQIQRLDTRSTQSLEELVHRARAIDNESDRLYVIAILATCISANRGTRRRDLLDEVLSNIEHIPVISEQLNLYETIADLIVALEPALCRTCLHKAITAALIGDDPDVYAYQRRIVSMAYRIDPSLASSFASLADDDPARARSRRNLRSHLQQLQLEEDLADLRERAGSNKAIAKDRYPDAAWSLLGKLHANRVSAVHMAAVLPRLEVAAKLPLDESYPIHAWAIENAVRRMEQSGQAKTQLRDFFRATVLATELALRIAMRTSKDAGSTISNAGTFEAENRILVREGQRDIALRFIHGWLSRSMDEYLKICDPYFGPEDLEILKLVQQANPACRVEVLTGLTSHHPSLTDQELVEMYTNQWRIRLSDQAPPDTDIVIVGTEAGRKSPIHDRWWITRESGLRIGTSFNSLGLGKSSEITVLDRSEASQLEAVIDQYLQRRKRDHDGERLRYRVFTLS